MRQLTVDKLAELRLGGMLKCLQTQASDAQIQEMEFEDRLLMLLDAEEISRNERSLNWKLRSAGLRQNARLEELDYRGGRRVDRNLLERLRQGQWLKDRRNLIVTGPTGVGKTFIASALAFEACRSRAHGKVLPNTQATRRTCSGQGAGNDAF